MKTAVRAAETTPAMREPVTVVVTRHVRPGHEADYEQWLRRINHEASAFAGYLGTEVHPPAPEAPVREYTNVFRFDSVPHLKAFEHSEVRQRYLSEVVNYVEADSTWHDTAGFEFWFLPPKGTVVAKPSRLRMAGVTTVVLYVMIMTVGRLLGFYLDFLPLALRTLVILPLEVLLMTYVLMPRVTRVLARWIYPRTAPTHT